MQPEGGPCSLMRRLMSDQNGLALAVLQTGEASEDGVPRFTSWSGRDRNVNDRLRSDDVCDALAHGRLSMDVAHRVEAVVVGAHGLRRRPHRATETPHHWRNLLGARLIRSRGRRQEIAMAAMDISLNGKTALVTGANTGIGFVTARELARAGARVWMACRSKDKARAAIARIKQAVPHANLAFLALDLHELAAVRRAADEFLTTGERLHLLINNAGLAGSRGKTADGFELQFGTNHLAPYLFTRLLLDRVKESTPSRIVFVSSKGHYRSRGVPWEHLRETTRSRSSLEEYCNSKLCNVLTAKAFAKRLEGTGVTTYALHPGVVASDIWRKVPQPFRWIALRFMLTNEEGALTTLRCAMSPDVANESGLYYDAQKPKRPSKLAEDAQLAEELWGRSAAWVGVGV